MTKLGLALAGLATTVLIAGCGGNDDSDSPPAGAASQSGASGDASASDEGFADASAEDIVSSAKEDMGALTSVKVSGTFTTDGTEITLDLQMDSDGNCTGSLTTAQGEVELLGADGQTWMKPDQAFWTSMAGSQADQVIKLVGDKWVIVPSDEASFDKFCDSDELIQQMLAEDTDKSTYTKVGADSVDGQDVVKVDSKDSDGQTSTGYVLVADPHYLVKIEQTDGDEPGAITFSEFDADVQTEAPADGDAIDLSKLSS